MAQTPLGGGVSLTPHVKDILRFVPSTLKPLYTKVLPKLRGMWS